MQPADRPSSASPARGAGTWILALGVAVSLHAAALAAPWHGGSSAPSGPTPQQNPHAHLQQPGAPVPPKPGGVTTGGTNDAPTAASAASTGGGRGGSATSRGPSGSALGAGGGAGVGRGQRGGGGSSSSTGGFDLALMPDTWEQWWHDNQDRFLDLRSQLAGGQRESGAQRPLTGMGRASAAPTRRASDEAVTRDILPVLFAQLAHESEPEILDSALIALGRCTPEDQADRLLVAVKPLLAHHVLSVQTSAVLALGIQGSSRFVPLLGHLMADTTTGRDAVGGGTVPTVVRAVAALSLGLGNHPSGVPMLGDLVQNLPDAERDLKACALTALGLTRNEAGDEALTVLLGLLADRRLDSLLKAHVPLAIARIDDGSRTEAVPALLAAMAHKDTDDAVRGTCAMALGRLASALDAGALELLERAQAESSHERTRHASLLALAEIGRRDLPDESAHEAVHARIAQVLTTALESAATPTDRAWAALSIGIYVRDGAALGPQLVEKLASTFRQQRNPSVRGACGLALGLAGARDLAPEIVEDFRKPGDERLRGYAAVALGLLGSQDALGEMLAVCADKSSDPGLREQVAVGLALLGTPDVVTALVAVLQDVEVHPVSVSVARALGRIGDRAAIEPLALLAAAADRQPSTRGMACVALGLLGERGALPWNASLKENRVEDARVATLDLVLDIL